jgi:hypothetical protein
MANQKHAYLTADQTLVYLTARGGRKRRRRRRIYSYSMIL